MYVLIIKFYDQIVINYNFIKSFYKNEWIQIYIRYKYIKVKKVYSQNIERSKRNSIVSKWLVISI